MNEQQGAVTSSGRRKAGDNFEVQSAMMLSEERASKNKPMEYMTICPWPDINVIKDKGRAEKEINIKN